MAEPAVPIRPGMVHNRQTPMTSGWQERGAVWRAARRMLTAAALAVALASSGCGGEPPVAPTPRVAAPVLPDAPIPTPGARIRVANVGDTDILFTWLDLPREVIRFREVSSNSVTEYVTTEHGAYEGVPFSWAIGDQHVPPFRPGREPSLPAPLGGYAFTYYVRLEPDLPYPPYVRIVRITRDE
ncbi:MAG: hypothetical protein IT181_26320 [Acidobacteria bacterium]|nr:hypothetical protein [Acidobacteriota bacterium]